VLVAAAGWNTAGLAEYCCTVRRRWPRRHLLTAVLGGVALTAAIVWLAVATWQYFHPSDLPSLLGDTAPVTLATVAGIAALVGGLTGLAFSPQRTRFLALTLVTLAGLSAPLAVTGITLATLNDWNFANRAFIGALFPFIAAELDADLPQVTTTTHYVIHHSRPLPDWEVQGLERQWRDLRRDLGSEPPERIALYLDDAGTIRQRLGGDGATDGRLVFSPPLPAATGCATALHEIAHSFMYTRRSAYSMPQLLDEGLARSHQGCSLQELDQPVIELARLGFLVPLEDRLTAADFSSARYGGASTGYAVAGSFVDYLIRAHGVGHFLRLVDSTGVETLPATAPKIYGIPFSQLESAWLVDIAQREGIGPLRFPGTPR